MYVTSNVVCGNAPCPEIKSVIAVRIPFYVHILKHGDNSLSLIPDDFVTHCWCHEGNDVSWWFCETFLMVIADFVASNEFVNNTVLLSSLTVVLLFKDVLMWKGGKWVKWSIVHSSAFNFYGICFSYRQLNKLLSLYYTYY